MYRLKIVNYLLIVLVFYVLPVSAQKKVLDHSVYDSWKSFGDISVTDDGKYSVCVVREQEGNDQILIRQLSSNRLNCVCSPPQALRSGCR